MKDMPPRKLEVTALTDDRLELATYTSANKPPIYNPLENGEATMHVNDVTTLVNPERGIARKTELEELRERARRIAKRRFLYNKGHNIFKTQNPNS